MPVEVEIPMEPEMAYMQRRTLEISNGTATVAFQSRAASCHHRSRDGRRHRRISRGRAAPALILIISSPC